MVGWDEGKRATCVEGKTVSVEGWKYHTMTRDICVGK